MRQSAEGAYGGGWGGLGGPLRGGAAGAGYLFTMSSLHAESLDEHVDVDKDHVDRRSELG